jgi:uncharacterized protein YbjT (DUF2867 family)
VLVIGATGQTGAIATRILLERGDAVTAFVRNPATFATTHERLSVAVGDARDGGALERAIRGNDAVLSALGPRGLGKSDLQAVFMRALVDAMGRAGVKRLSNLSAWGAGDSWATFPLYGKLAVSTLLRNVFADKNRGEVALHASALDYVNVRPGPLGNGPPRGGARASADGRDVAGLPPMRRADLAAFMVEALTDETWLRKEPILGY